MEWKKFFTLTVWKEDERGRHPYFHSELSVPEIAVEDVLLSKFLDQGLTPQEIGRLTLGHRKILHSLHFFNSLEFHRISENFMQRLSREEDQELRFHTTAGGIYLFLALIKHSPDPLKNKSIYCETTEIPIPVMQLPPTPTVGLKLIYSPQARSYLAGLPSLWGRPEVLRLFDKKEWAHVA